MIHATMQIKVENTVLSERSQTQKVTLSIIQLYEVSGMDP